MEEGGEEEKSPTSQNVMSEEERQKRRAERFGLADEAQTKQPSEAMEATVDVPASKSDAKSEKNHDEDPDGAGAGKKRSRLSGRLGVVTSDREQKEKKPRGEMDLERHLESEEAKLMQELGVTARTQTQLEHKVVSRLEQAAEQREKEEHEVRAKKEEEKRQSQIAMLQMNVVNIEKKLNLPAFSSQPQQEALQKQMVDVRAKLKALTQQNQTADPKGKAASQLSPKPTPSASAVLSGKTETERERMIRIGMITPFSGREGSERVRLPTSPSVHSPQPVRPAMCRRECSAGSCSDAPHQAAVWSVA